MIIGISLVGATFYGLINNYFLTSIISRTLGPYSDSLTEHVFEHPDPEIWKQIAARHHVAILVEPVGTTILAVIILDEQPTALEIVGSLVVLSGVYLALRPAGREAPAPELSAAEG